MADLERHHWVQFTATAFLGPILCDGVIWPVAAPGPELRRSCNPRYQVLRASGHLDDDPARAPFWQSNALL